MSRSAAKREFSLNSAAGARPRLLRASAPKPENDGFSFPRRLTPDVPHTRKAPPRRTLEALRARKRRGARRAGVRLSRRTGTREGSRP
jgi:hypothetical protein